jgi:hypothetical protein
LADATTIVGLSGTTVTLSQPTLATAPAGTPYAVATVLGADLAQHFATRQAERPIIEFVRDLMMWQVSDSLSVSSPADSTRLTFASPPPISLDANYQIAVSGDGLGADTVVTAIGGNTVTITPALIAPIAAGSTIIFTQLWSEDLDPLFMLYDLGRQSDILSPGNVALIDPSRYPLSNFRGNRIFGYAAGSGAIDPVLRRALSIDANGNIEFSNDAASVVYTSNDNPIVGLYCYATDDTVNPMVFTSLWHPAGTTRQLQAPNGLYEIPVNLQANPLAEEVGLLSLADCYQHFVDLVGSQIGATGIAAGSNNYRDTRRDLSLGTQVLQHQATLLKAMLLASSETYDLPAAIIKTDHEYNRFRNKFARKLVDLRNRGVLSSSATPPSVCVGTTLAALTIGLTATSPFALSTMGGGQYFIPSTPTGLGIAPAAVPSMLVDTTYPQPVSFLQGHDGSLTPAFGDWRDAIMLALEQQIYANLPAQFQTEAKPLFDIRQWMNSKFYTNAYGYQISEVNQMLAPSFELWAQNNQFDYHANTTYDASDPFTWNYRGANDRFGNPLQGSWRAIYTAFYGTDAPHTRPWEMFGFLYEPAWWQSAYGAPPYGASNRVWADAAVGTIAGGVRQGVDVVYARSGILDLIPVDAQGNLRNPVQLGLIAGLPYVIAGQPWQMGDYGPAETIWRQTPSYRFALANISFLMKPALFVDSCWNVLNFGVVEQQWVALDRLRRPLDSTAFVHGEIDANGNVVSVTGLSQWLVDYLRSCGTLSSGLGDATRGLTVRLVHQAAGFISGDDLQVQADSFGLVPAENVNLVLYTSPVFATEVYSGVLITWTGASWKVLGYDARTPAFTIIPPDTRTANGVISLSMVQEPTIYPWRPNTYYQLGTFVVQQNSVYECSRGHTSGPSFEQAFWLPRSDMSPNVVLAPRVVVYRRGLNSTQSVPYATEFTSYQQVGDFLLGYERYLVSRGWVFSGVDPQTGTVLNWSYAVQEFLSWTQVKWQPGNFIALSPGQRWLQYSTEFGTINNVEDHVTGFFGLLDRSGQPISEQNVVISRLDGALTIAALNADIFLSRLAISGIEHLVVFDNVTIFDDNIYLPLFNLRLPRLRLNCRRAVDWAGRLDAPGFVINGNQLASNYAKSADDVRLMFDIELADVANLRDYARHVIGYANRDYLDALLLSEVAGFEFYQGMIQQKGAPGVFQTLMRSNRASGNSNLTFLEEWAIRLDQFGAPLDDFITFQLAQTDTRTDPQLISLTPINGAPLTWITLTANDPRWYDKPASATTFFASQPGFRPPALPSAGPVRLGDVDNTVYHLTDLPALYTTLSLAGLPTLVVASTIWVYERADGSYTVLEVFETGAQPNALASVVSAAEDASVTTTRLYFVAPLTTTLADIGSYLVIDAPSNSTPELEGIQTIIAIDPTLNTIDIETISSAGYVYTSDAGTPAAPFMRIIREVRFASLAALNACGYQFAAGDLAWVDGRPWQVMQWTNQQWLAVRQQPNRIDPSHITDTTVYAAGTQVIGNQMVLNQPVIDTLDVLDPLAGLFAGVAQREVTYVAGYDPAGYNAGGNTTTPNPWGGNQIGQVWWDLSTVKFLDPYTDTVGISAARDVAELAYRRSVWAQVAPLASVDVYEWTASRLDALTYSLQAATTPSMGRVYQGTQPSWATQTVYDPLLGQDTVMNYFWVAGLGSVPDVPFRSLSVSAIASAIANPSGQNIPWMAAIAPTALLVSGVAGLLNDTTTVMKVVQQDIPDLAGRHDQWILMRPGDTSSLPTPLMWGKLRDSLAGFAVGTGLTALPDASLAATRNTGIGPLQNMFTVDTAAGPRTGLAAARQAFVQSVNSIFAATPVTQTRSASLATLVRPDAVAPLLIWSQINPSYPIEPPPANEWTVEVFSLAERNRLIARADFLQAAVTGQSIQVLINGLAQPIPGWSIWTFNALAAQVINANYQTQNSQATPAALLANLLANIDTVFGQTPTRAYDYSVSSELARDQLVGVQDGDRVLVASTTTFWAIWKYSSTTGYQLWRAQNYQLDFTADGFLSYVDWYAPGYSPSNPPVVSYANTAARDRIEGIAPVNLLVKILDDGNTPSGFIWTAYQTVSDTLISVSASAAANATAVTAVSSMNGIEVGMTVGGVGIAAGSTITAISPIGFTLSLATVAAIAGTLTLGAAQAWVTVAIENGTIELSSNLYDPTRVVETGTWLLDPALPTSVDATLVALRDGSWELRVLADALCYGGLLLAAEINTLWFNMIAFVHTQQDDIDWVFKTSFLNMVGYDVPLIESPYTPIDQTGSLISYIDEVKPYRVKVRTYSTQYTTPIDIANFHATDFDKPVYYDPALAAYRPLDPVIDTAILQTAPYIDWYTAYLAYEAFVAGANGTATTTTGNTPALFRQFDLTLRFDRVVGNVAAAGWDDLPWNAQPFDDATAETNPQSGAMARILNYYAPTGDMPVGVTALLNLQFKAGWSDGFLLNSLDLPDWSEQLTTGWDQAGITAATVPSSTLDGGGLLPGPVAADINAPLPDEPGGLELRAPYRAQEHPEERIPFAADDGLQVIVTTDARSGALPQAVKLFTISNAHAPVTLFYDLMAQSAAAVMVFNNGLRARPGIDFTVDQFARTVTINPTVNDAPLGRVLIHAFGFGGDTAVTESQFLTYGVNPLVTRLTTTPAFLSVIVDGTVLAPSAFTLSDNAVTLSNPPVDQADVALIGYRADCRLACSLQQQQLDYGAAQLATGGMAWTLSNRDDATIPEHAGTIVELNGRRLTPPSTFYGGINNPATPWVYLPIAPATASTITVFVDDIEYMWPIPFCTDTDPASHLPFQLVVPNGEMPASTHAGRFVFFDQMLVALDPSFVAANIAVVMTFANRPADYSVTDGVLTCYHALQAGDDLWVTTFSNADCLGIKTLVYPTNETNCYVIPSPHAPEYSLITADGLTLTPGDDYQIAATPISHAGLTFPLTTLTVDRSFSGTLVATLFTAKPASEAVTWLSRTRTPAFLRMTPAVSDDGPLYGVPVNGYDQTAPLLQMTDGFEQLIWSPMQAGSLADDCALGATEIVVNLFPQPMSTKLTTAQLADNGEIVPVQPLPLPNAFLNTPGVVWIEMERVEYFAYSEAVSAAGIRQATLGQLRRGTHATPMGAQRVVQRCVGTGVTTTYRLSHLGAVDVLIDYKPVSTAAYNVVVSGAETEVTLAAPSGSVVMIGISTEATHLQGASVFANQPYTPIAAYPSAHLPGPVTGLQQLGGATENSVVVQWNMPQYGQGAFTYDVGYRVTTGSRFIPVISGTSLTSVSIGQLQPGHSYDVEVISVDSYGVHGPGSILTPIFTLPLADGTTMSPIDSSALITFSNNLLTVSL